jgi:predicted nucleic acid-binding protein
MAARYLIDTSAVIKYLNATLPSEGLAFMDEVVDQECVLSFISEVELQVWNPENPEDLDVYQQFVSSSTIFGINDAIIKETIRIRKHHKVKLPDAFIAATAIVNALTLIADNDKDFQNISRLNYLNPQNPGVI